MTAGLQGLFRWAPHSLHGSKTRGLGLQRGSECRLNAESLNELIMALSRPAVARRSQRGRGGTGGADTVATLRLQGALVSRDVRVLSEGPQSYFLSLGLGLCGALVR